MCTVSFIPKGKGTFILTSNRDEAPNRETDYPAIYNINDTKMVFPKDAAAGGTWVGVSEKQRLICLLNGGFVSHKRKSAYRMSRGVVVKDLLSCNNIIETVKNYKLDDIEPFTIVIVDWKDGLKLYELVWDEHKKHLSELPIKARLWSSSTLYSPKMKAERQQWFGNYVFKNDYSAESILNFHQTAGKENMDYGTIMDRVFVKTTSITQIEALPDSIEMRYRDLQKETLSIVNLPISEVVNE